MLGRYSLRVRIFSHELKTVHADMLANAITWDNLVQFVDGARSEATSTDLEKPIGDLVAELSAEQHRLRGLIEISYGKFAPHA